MESLDILKSIIFLGALLLTCCDSANGNKTNHLSADEEKGTSPDTIVIKVNHYRIPCNGEGQQLCYEIQEAGESSWKQYYGSIQNLNYQWGYLYKLRVVKEKLQKPSIIGDSFYLKVIATIEETKVLAEKTFTLSLNRTFLEKSEEKEIWKLISGPKIACPSENLAEALLSRIQSGSDFLGKFKHDFSDENSIQLISLED